MWNSWGTRWVLVSAQAMSPTQVLQQTPGPTGPVLHLAPTFECRDNQDKLEQFIRQFICS